MCAPDELDPSAHGRASARDGIGERFLVYAPQFGLSNQVVALRNAVVWALLLNRTLVLPHLLGHGTAATMAPHGAAFDAPRAAAAIADALRVEEMPAFLARGLEPRGVLVLDINIRMRVAGDDAYFEALGVRWHNRTAPLRVPMADFTPASIVAAFGGCTAAHHRVLAFRSLFAALDAKGPKDYPPPGFGWLNRVAMPALLKPAPALSALVDRIQAHLVAGCAASGTLRGAHATSRPACASACVHVRQGDFSEECAKYDAELRSKGARPWVLSHARRGYSCIQSESTLVTNLRSLQGRLPHGKQSPIYASIEDSSFLQRPALRPFNLSSLAAHADVIRAAAHPGTGGVHLPDGIGSVLLDQLVCARASHLLLNAFSTFSQLVMGRMGMARPDVVGWARDLNDEQQRRLGVSVGFWRTDYWKRQGYV